VKSSLHRLIPFLPLFCSCQLNSIPLLPSSYPCRLGPRNSIPFCAVTASQSQSQSQSYIKSDGQPVSLSWNKAPIWGLRRDLDYCLTVAGLLIWGTVLTRGRVCRLQLLLVLASAVIFGSESSRTRDHILLSHIRDFPFRRLLQLSGSRWRYSIPLRLHTGGHCQLRNFYLYNTLRGSHKEHSLFLLGRHVYSAVA
jgi:hypothetical protein